MEECVRDMGQRENTNNAAAKGAQVLLSREEYALNMVQRSNDAAVKGAQIKFKMEEYEKSMEQRSNDAASKDAQTNPNEEEYAGDTVHTAIQLMSLPLSHRVSDQILIRLP